MAELQTPSPDRPRLARALLRHRAALLVELYALDWASDAERPLRLVAGESDPAARSRAEAFLNALIEGVEGNDWRRFDGLIATRTIELLVAGVVSVEQLNARALGIATMMLPAALEEPDPGPVIAALFEVMQAISGRIVSGYNDRLLTEARQLDDLKTMFMRMTGHELRAPLGTIRGYASMLREGDFGTVSELMDGVFRQIDASAASGLGMIERLSEMAHLESRAEALRREPRHLREILELAVEPLRPAARQKDVELVLDAEDGEAAVDSEEIAIALRNLLGNALKYASEGGRIELRAGRENGGTVFEVRDFGPGIAAAELPLVFDRYYRSTDARYVAGSGLGLYIVRRVAELHGGEASAESTLGQGATFRIRIPAAAPVPETAP